MLSVRLQEIIEPLVEALGYELVLVEFHSGASSAVLRIFIDSDNGIGLEDCEAVSREAAAVLDVEDPISQAYQLEVSSPGLDRPLTKPIHFERFKNHKARVELSIAQAGRKRFTGRISNAAEQSFVLETDSGPVELAYSMIERARLVPEFN
ncbi:MAG: ribosome maturation factor RimP [Panacagrimonas sp.]